MGGFFSLVTIIFLVVLIVIFGRPFLNKQDPNVIVQSSDLEYYPLMQANFTNFPIAFRFENEKRAKAEIGSYLFPWLELVRMKKNSDGYMSVVSLKNMNYTTCSRDNVKDPAILMQVDGWNCVDWTGTDNELGGNWDAMSTYAYYFKITVFFCKYDGKSYTNCTDFKKLDNMLNGKTKVYLSLNIPTVSTTPSNYDRPLKTTTSNVFFTLNPLLMRTERYSYRNVTVQQNIGWFLESLRSFTGFTLDKRDTDLQIRTVDDYNDPNKIKTIATCVFIYTNKVEQTEVSFSKIPTVAANVGGVMTIFMEIFRMICCLYGSQTVYYDIINFLSKIAYQENGVSSTKLSMQMIKFKQEEHKPDELFKSKSSLKSINDIRQFNNFMQRARSETQKKSEIIENPQLNNFMQRPNQISDTSRKSLIIKKIEESTSRYSDFYQFIKNKICCNTKKIDMQFYSKHEVRIKNKLDILNYLQLSNRFDVFSSLILNKVQNLCVKNMSKMGILSDDHITLGKMKLEEQIELDTFLKSDISTQSEMDRKILDIYVNIIN